MFTKHGQVHRVLNLLDSGDILMTYMACIGELDGQTCPEIETILGHDNGKTLDWQNRLILFRRPNQILGSRYWMQLDDGDCYGKALGMAISATFR